MSYRRASALAVPFEPETFQGAYMMHVGMNTEEKTALFAEIPPGPQGGRRLAIYDVMRAGEGELNFPVHRAAGSPTSFVIWPEVYRRSLEAAGFQVCKQRDRHAFAREFFRQVAARCRRRAPAAARGPPFDEE